MYFFGTEEHVSTYQKMKKIKVVTYGCLKVAVGNGPRTVWRIFLAVQTDLWDWASTFVGWKEKLREQLTTKVAPAVTKNSTGKHTSCCSLGLLVTSVNSTMHLSGNSNNKKCWILPKEFHQNSEEICRISVKREVAGWKLPAASLPLRP